MRTLSLKQRVRAFEKKVIEDAIRENTGNIAAVSRALKTDRKVIYQKIQRYKIKR